MHRPEKTEKIADLMLDISSSKCYIQSIFFTAMKVELKMHECKAKTYRMPLTGSGRFSCRDSASWLSLFCANDLSAAQSRAANPVLLASRSEDCGLRKASSVFLQTADFRPVREHKPRTASVQTSACRHIPPPKQRPFAILLRSSMVGRFLLAPAFGCPPIFTHVKS